MNVIDCKEIRSKMIEEAKREIESIQKKLLLTIIQVGNDDASSLYVRNKEKTCREVGIEPNIVRFPKDATFDQIADEIIAYGQTDCVTGIMLQLPLPDHLKDRQRELIDLIPYEKDVDGLSSESIGRLWAGKRCITPATPTGILRILPDDLSGKSALIIGRSDLVGKPMIKLLLDRNASVSVCHSKSTTYQIDEHIEHSNIVISAIGKPRYICASRFINMWKYDNVEYWIDVGMNRDDNGKLCGDINMWDVEYMCVQSTYVTPVPGGVGQLTTAQLILNVIEAYRIQSEDERIVI